jgi:hypothetical protein
MKNQCQEHERLEQEQHEERDYDYYGPYYNHSHLQHSPEGGCNEEVKAFSQDLKRVRCPLNFKPSGIEKYDGSMSYPVPRERERSLHTCAQDVQITRTVTI